MALAPDGTLILIELKRGKTPREVVAQAIDYASWLQNLESVDLSRIFSRFSGGKSLADEFNFRFGSPLDESVLNESHQIVIVATSLDPSSERIVGYLNQRDIPINVLFFQIFDTGSEQILSRAWLLDPTETQLSAQTSQPAAKKEPWNGEYYVSYGHGMGRTWSDAVEHGFVSAGGGSWYSNTLSLLKANDRIWVKAPQHGFVGVGRVTGPPEPASEFKIKVNGQDVLAVDALKSASYHREHIDDPDKMEYFVPVEWAQTVPIQQAVSEIGLFGNQNTVCAPKTPKWRHTVEKLEKAFPDFWKAKTSS